MNAVSGTILGVLLLIICFAPRQWALLAMMAGVFFLSQGHSVNVAGLSLYPLRFLEAVALVRVLGRRELVWSRLNRIDWTLLLVYNYAALVWILRSSTITAQQFAAAVDPTLCYLALRALLRNVEDLRWFLSAFVVLLVPFTALVFLERLSGQNSFAIVGNTDPLYFRNGVPRCMGSFRHAILLGSVAASFLALYIGLWRTATRRLVGLFGAFLCLSLVVLSNSGGPLTSAAAAFLGWLIWPLRERLHLVRGTVLVLLLLLSLFMKAPIWYLPFKISAVVGGGGFHRGALMEQAWNHLDEWWLAGMEIQDTARWFPYVHTLIGGADVTNQFIVFGLRAGLAALVLFVVLLVVAFNALGRALAAVRLSNERARARELLLWGLGVSLLVHSASWLGVAYFDQSWAVWLMHLATVSACAQTRGLRAWEPDISPTMIDATDGTDHPAVYGA